MFAENSDEEMKVAEGDDCCCALGFLLKILGLLRAETNGILMEVESSSVFLKKFVHFIKFLNYLSGSNF